MYNNSCYYYRKRLKQMAANWAIESNSKKQDILWNQIEETEKKINDFQV